MQSTFTPSRSSSSRRSSGSKRASWSSAAAPRSHAATNALRADSDQPLAAVHQQRSPGRAPYQCSAWTLWPGQVAVPVADRLRLARGPGGEHDQRRVSRPLRRGRRGVPRRAPRRARPAPARRSRRPPRARGRARRPPPRAAPPCPCGRAGRRGAAARCTAAPRRRSASRRASRRPTRAGCPTTVITTSPRPTPARRQRARQARGAVGHLAEGDLAPLAVAADRDERQPRRVRGVHDLGDEAHSGRRPALAAAEPLEPEPGEVHRDLDHLRARPPGVGPPVRHRLRAADEHLGEQPQPARPPPRVERGAPGSCEMSTVTSAVTCSSIRSSTAADSGSEASRNSIRQASRRSSTNAKKASSPAASRSALDSTSSPTARPPRAG